MSSVDKAIALLSSYGIHVVNETFSFVKRWARLSAHHKRKRTQVAVVVIPLILVIDAIHSAQSGNDYFSFFIMMVMLSVTKTENISMDSYLLSTS